MDVPARLLSNAARLPSRAHAEDAAFDLYADAAFELAPGARATVTTGVAIALPPGACALVLPRSGLAARHGVTVLNAPGLIDAGYRGEILVILHNSDLGESFAIAPGERIAQLMILAPAHAVLRAVEDELPASVRGQRGLGSSGR